MLFNSYNFFIFICIIFFLVPFLPHRKQNIFLLISSYLFYSFWDWRFSILLAISTSVDFFSGKKIYSSASLKVKNRFLFFSVFVNIGILCFFKYFNFFIESTFAVFSSIGINVNLQTLNIFLPIGISFYTFKTLSYTFDIYKCKLKPTNNFFYYALYTSFFPQILAGPIERASSLLPQISNPRKITRSNVLSGLNLILIGYFKKVAIADTLAPIADKYFNSPSSMTCGQLWSGIYAYTFQIYGDFSGYTDIACGIALVLGFKAVKNFDAPYLSRSVTEFWKRWHISLSTWFLDYLYIPLGGNRRGKIRTYLNLFLTMAICGLWHGAAWTFVIWGMLHGLFLVVHRILLHGKKANTSWPKSFSVWLFNFIKIFANFHLIVLAWVLFKASNLDSALTYYNGLFRFDNFSGFSLQVLFAGSLLFFLDIIQVWFNSETWLTRFSVPKVIRYAIIQVLLISVISAAIAHLGTKTPFIYFQF